MMTAIRRSLLVSVATAGILALMATTAFAHFCYNASRSEQGNKGASHSAAWVPAEDILRDAFGICAEGIEHFTTETVALGYPDPLLIHDRALLASGVAETGKSYDDKGIDHLNFAEIDPIVGEAAEICASQG